MGRDESARELRAVAALIVTGPEPQLVGPCTLVTNGAQTVAYSSAELLRRAGEPLAIVLTHDLSRLVPVTAWTMARSPHMGIIDLGASFPAGPGLDVEPLSIGSVLATPETRGAPSAVVTVALESGRIERRVMPVHVDAVDGGGMSDDIITRLASPDDVFDVGADVDGASLFAWMPADPVLGRKAEVVVVALACRYNQKTFKPRELPAFAELYGLEDLARVLPWRAPAPAGAVELGQVVGEIKDDVTVRVGSLEVDLEGD